MVSLLGSDGLIRYHGGKGFVLKPLARFPAVELEISGGYYAYLRGDRESRSTFASVFQSEPYTQPSGESFLRGPLLFALSQQYDRIVAHWAGPEGLVAAFLREIAKDREIPIDSESLDIDIALNFWAEPPSVRYITTRPGDSTSPKGDSAPDRRRRR
jgi:hypothetical protein